MSLQSSTALLSAACFGRILFTVAAPLPSTCARMVWWPLKEKRRALSTHRIFSHRNPLFVIVPCLQPR